MSEPTPSQITRGKIVLRTAELVQTLDDPAPAWEQAEAEITAEEENDG